MSLTDVAAATGGRLVGPAGAVSGASFDTRTLRPGELFVPVVAGRDGHDFVAAAVAAGAGAYLTSRGVLDAAGPLAAVEVDDTGAALLALASWAVSRLGAEVVAVTGSVGKTTTKDLAAAAIAAGRRVTANTRSFNNDQGLPVTVLGAPDDTEVLVLEMGMRGFGEITRLCRVARPRIGVVTAVAPAHTERVGGIDGVARAKAELVEALPADGVAILNADDPRVAAMAARAPGRVLTFGAARGADVSIGGLVLDELARPRFTLSTPWGAVDVAMAASGRHMAANAAAAVAAAASVGVPLEGAAAAIATAELSPSRMAVHRLPGGAVLIDDAYNANPTSMRAALDALAAIPAARRLAVLGVMAELDDPDLEHRRIAEYAAARGIEILAVGTDRYGRPPVDDPVAAVGEVGPGVAVVVKGSLVAGLQAVAAELRARHGT